MKIVRSRTPTSILTRSQETVEKVWPTSFAKSDYVSTFPHIKLKNC